MSTDYKYYAFISYASADAGWGRKVQRRLEHYRMPATLCSEHGWQRRPLRPVFFAPTDIQPGDLSEELKARLQASRNLIVIASPRSAQSEWVCREIAYFHSLPQGNNIYFFIVDGCPMSGDPTTECYHPILKQLGIAEPLGANIHEHNYRLPWLNRERAYIQLITRLLGIEFDALWRRHRRQRRQQALLWVAGLTLVAVTTASVVRMNGNVEVTLTVREATVHNDQLPPRTDAVIQMWIDGEERCDTLRSEADTVVRFGQVPRRMLGSKVRVRFECYDFLPVDTLMPLTKAMELPYRRDALLFGLVEFTLMNQKGTPQGGHQVTVGGVSARSDADGHVSMRVPLERQAERYRIEADIPLLDTMISVPCGSGVVVYAK